MAVWALADLHLSFGTPDKEMDVFGENWKDHPKRIEENWRAKISNDDLVLIPGDISWALRLEDAIPDLKWIHELPGTKVMLRGNHDFWWSSLRKIAEILPSSIHLIQNNTFSWNQVCIAGSRLWDTWEYNFNKYIPYNPNPISTLELQIEKPEDLSQRDKIYERELLRLETSLKAINKGAEVIIAMTHYPPISADLKHSRAAELLEYYHVNICTFGHLHNVVHDFDPLFGEHHGVRYVLSAADYLNFDPVLLYE